MIEDFKKARAAGVPIIHIHSIDPVATMNSIQMSISGAIDSPGESEYRNSIVPIVQWDIISAMHLF